MAWVAKLSNKEDYIEFACKQKNIIFKGPYSLEYFDKVKSWDHGYIVVDVKYANRDELIEDYIDLVPMLDRLYIDSDSFLEGIGDVEIVYE